MKKTLLLLTAIPALLLGLVGCTSSGKTAGEIATVSIAPKPSSYVKMQGEFELTGNSRIVVIADNHYNEVKRNVAEYLVDIIRASTGFGIAVADDQENPADGDIVFTLASLDGASSESYNLKVETNRITITANEPEGLFRAVQTLRQLFGPDIERKSVTPGKKWSVACASITDSPAYPYRGLMLDVARHFFPKEEVMRQIDLAAQYKINKLHLHLTDDQGWRIEIKSRPALTEIGSLGAINGDKGGYYTQDDFKAIVEYAAKRYIEVIPEIDMPGHTNAALVSIPELNPDGKAAKPRTDFAVGYSTLQCRSEITYQFIDDVIKELAEISPSPYIHIGGDEADSTSASDYNYFIERVSEIVKKYGKTTVGWTPYERSNGTLEDAVIQNWFCTQASFNISRQKNMGSILSPAAAYLDQKYNPGTRLGQDWRGHISLKTSYNWYPAKLAPKNVLLGIESALWSETLVTGDDIDFMLYPRLIANAEVGWTAEDSRNFSEFMSRLPRQLVRLDALGVKYSTKYN